MTLQQDNGFGRRNAVRPTPPAEPTSPLLKQIGGILVGVAIAFALGGAYVVLMKQAGRTLDQKFVENFTAGAPAEAIQRIKEVDANLDDIHRTCTARTKTVGLDRAQSQAVEGYMQLFSGESELARGAAYIECLATSQPARFCQKPHKAHLVAAVREYFKLTRQVQEEWSMALGGFGGLNQAALMGTPFGSQQRAKLAMPSTVTSPPMLASIRRLAADGYVSSGDFGGFAGTGVPRALAEALRGVEPKKAACA